MDLIPDIIKNVLILFLMMIPGVIIKKCNLISDGFGKGLSNLVLYIAQPALIFLAYVREFDKEILVNSLWVILFATVTHVIFALTSLMLFGNAEDAKRRMLRFATTFSNAAFMGIPLIGAVMGSDALIYASVYNIVFNLFLWSFGVNICTKEPKESENEKELGKLACQKNGGSLMKAVIHPVTLAAVLGLLFFFTPLNRFLNGDNYAGEIISESLVMLKALVAPLSMVVIGIRLADMNLNGFFGDKYLYLFLSLRHILLPLAAAAVIRLLMLTGASISADILKVVVILACAPAATSSTMFAEKYDCDSEYVSKLVAVSTIISIITMPAVIFISTLGLS